MHDRILPRLFTKFATSSPQGMDENCISRI